jgi:hypothetical protein
MADPSSAIMFRASLSLRRELEEAAQQNCRSLGKEVVYRLEQFNRTRRRKQVRKNAGTSEARP